MQVYIFITQNTCVHIDNISMHVNAAFEGASKFCKSRHEELKQRPKKGLFTSLIRSMKDSLTFLITLLFNNEDVLGQVTVTLSIILPKHFLIKYSNKILHLIGSHIRTPN